MASRRRAWASRIGDYNRDGLLDIVKTNFAGDTDSLYMNLGDGSFDDRTYQAGLGINTRLLGWGVSFIDIDNDGWLDILIANGHVYPEVDGTQVDAGLRRAQIPLSQSAQRPI